MNTSETMAIEYMTHRWPGIDWSSCTANSSSACLRN